MTPAFPPLSPARIAPVSGSSWAEGLALALFEEVLDELALLVVELADFEELEAAELELVVVEALEREELELEALEAVELAVLSLDDCD